MFRLRVDTHYADRLLVDVVEGDLVLPQGGRREGGSGHGGRAPGALLLPRLHFDARGHGGGRRCSSRRVPVLRREGRRGRVGRSRPGRHTRLDHVRVVHPLRGKEESS